MNATYNEQKLGKLLSLTTVRARTSDLQQYTLLGAADNKQQEPRAYQHRPRAPVTVTVRAARLEYKRGAAAAFDADHLCYVKRR